MKKLILFAFLLTSIFARAQERSSIAISYGFGNGSLFSLLKKDGGGSMSGKSLTNIGFNYGYALKDKNWHLEMGIHYLVYKYTVTSSYPFLSQMQWDYTKNILSLPVKFKYEVGKYIFFNGNLYLDMDVSKNSRSRQLSGIGAGLGMGGQYYLNDKVGIYINPQFDFRNIASISGSHYKLLGAGLNMGLAYRIK